MNTDDLREQFFIMESKTKTCYWCKRRKPTEQTYYITNKGKRQIRICVDCNLTEEVV